MVVDFLLELLEAVFPRSDQRRMCQPGVGELVGDGFLGGKCVCEDGSWGSDGAFGWVRRRGAGEGVSVEASEVHVEGGLVPVGCVWAFCSGSGNCMVHYIF